MGRGARKGESGRVGNAGLQGKRGHNKMKLMIDRDRKNDGEEIRKVLTIFLVGLPSLGRSAMCGSIGTRSLAQ